MIPQITLLAALAGCAHRPPPPPPSVLDDPAAVAAVLAEMVAADQALRNQFTGEDDPALFAAIATADASNTARLKDLIARHGWITVSAFGPIASQDAWILAQHADADPDFQREVLALMAPLVPAGEVRPGDYAYLHDRVAAAAGEPLRYGTQGRCEGEAWTPMALEDPEGIEARRAEVGLEPFTDYRATMDALCRGQDPAP